MKFHQLLSLTVLLGSPSMTAQLCGSIGISTIPPYFISTSPALHQAVACGEHCTLDIECQSYALGVGMCLHYSSPVSSIFEGSLSSPWTLYDRICTLDVAKDNSLAGVNQIVALAAPCLIDPSSTKSQFRLLGPDWVPLIEIAEEQLLFRGQVLVEQEQVQAIDSFDLLDRAPIFSFQESANAPAGLYDLIIGPEPKYVAKAADGGLVLTSASTGSTAQNVNGRIIATSIFTVDCDGRIGVVHEGVAYSWDITANGSNASFTAGAHSSDKTMLAFNLNFETSRHQREPRSLLEKRNIFRCKSGFWVREKAHARPPSANGCGSKSNHKIVPDFGFRRCCDSHDFCYDNCYKSFDECNNDFEGCMYDRCDVLFPKRWEIPAYAGCVDVAALYAAVVKGSFGANYFRQYGHERCECCRVFTGRKPPYPVCQPA